MAELRFDGRVAVVTGAGRGLGRAYALLLAARGASVVVNDLGGAIDGDGADASPAAEVVDEIVAAGGSAVADTLDVSTEDGAQGLIDHAVEHFGRLDAVVANAGIMRWAKFPDVPLEDVERHLAVHTVGSFLVARAAWPHLIESGDGRIVLTTSTGMLGLTGNTAYGVAKGGVLGLARSLAVAGRKNGIAANCIAPAASTRMAGDGGPDLPAELVAPMVAYLAHPDCPVSGEVYTAGGGRFARLFLGSTPGWVSDGTDPTPDDVAAHWAAINDETGATVPVDLLDWSAQFLSHLPAVVTEPLPTLPEDVSWFAVLADHAARTPDQAMTVFEGETTTYSEMAERAAALAAGFATHGIGAGDVIALLSYNCPEYLETIFAASHLGAIVMPINWRLAAPEVRYILEHSGARALVCDDALVDLADDAADGLEPGLLRARTSALGELCGLDGAAAAPVPGTADGLHRLMYTSGTTGRPKGVMLTNANLAWKNLAHLAEFGFTRTELGLACGPLYHVGALDLTTTTLIAVGATVIIHRAFDAAAVVDELERSRVTTVWLAPAMVNAIMALPDIEQRDLTSVRVIINGGEKMPIPLIEKIQRVFPSAWFADAYGLTETVSGDTFLDRDSLVTKLGSVGLPCRHLELDVWDEEQLSVAPGERGEIVLRGPKVSPGYWRDPEATEKAFAGGWFHTGDVGVRDEDGYLFIVDRLKDMIVSGGENIAGSEVERVLHEHPAVLEVAVVGRPDERWGEVPVAHVVLRPEASASEDELVEHCRGQLAKFKVPKAIRFLDALPRNPSGKVLKHDLREPWADVRSGLDD